MAATTAPGDAQLEAPTVTGRRSGSSRMRSAGDGSRRCWLATPSHSRRAPRASPRCSTWANRSTWSCSPATPPRSPAAARSSCCRRCGPAARSCSWRPTMTARWSARRYAPESTATCPSPPSSRRSLPRSRRCSADSWRSRARSATARPGRRSPHASARCSSWSRTARPTRRSPRSCTSRRARSRATWLRAFASSESPPGPKRRPPCSTAKRV